MGREPRVREPPSMYTMTSFAAPTFRNCIPAVASMVRKQYPDLRAQVFTPVNPPQFTGKSAESWSTVSARLTESELAMLDGETTLGALIDTLKPHVPQAMLLTGVLFGFLPPAM